MFYSSFFSGNWRKLEKAYEHVDDVDLFAGGLLETKGAGCVGGFEKCGILGPVFRTIVGETFEKLKFGDRYFYDLGEDKHKFTLPELDEIRKSSFSRILCDNTPITSIQPNAFLTAHPTLNFPQRQVVPCENIPSMDLSLFKGLVGKFVVF